MFLSEWKPGLETESSRQDSTLMPSWGVMTRHNAFVYHTHTHTVDLSEAVSRITVLTFVKLEPSNVIFDRALPKNPKNSHHLCVFFLLFPATISRLLLSFLLLQNKSG